MTAVVLRVLSLVTLVLSVAGCTQSTSTEEDAVHRFRSKADRNVFGMCGDANTCGGQGTGTCYCDSSCAQYGDCCEDYAAVCGGDTTPPTNNNNDGGVSSPPVMTTVPEFGDDATHQFAVIASVNHGLAQPRDVGFNPQNASQIWIVNQADNSMSVIQGWGSQQPSIGKYSGPGSDHFLAKPSALAFGTASRLATAHEEDQITQPNTPWNFMGPTLWTSDLSIFDGGHAGHYDMLHNTPNGAGIAWAGANAYFVFDGEHESITLYDFQLDHGPGGADHSDGIVRRYVEGQVSYVPGVPSHLEMDLANNRVYVADTGNRRVAVFDPTVGQLGGFIDPNFDGTDQRIVTGSSIQTVVGSGLVEPSGLALHNGRIFVSDHATGDIVAYSLDGTELARVNAGAPGLMGIAIGPDGRLYYVNGLRQELGVLVP